MKVFRKMGFIFILFLLVLPIITSLSNLFVKNLSKEVCPDHSKIESQFTLQPHVIWDNTPLTIPGQESLTSIDAVRFGDVTGDGVPEVVVALNSTIDYLLVYNSSNGKQLWNMSSRGLVEAFDQAITLYKREGFFFITDIQGDTQNEILIPHISYDDSVYGGKKANVTAINTATQSIIWDADIWDYGKYWMGVPISDWLGPDDIRSAAIGDVNSDGKSEIVVGVDGGPFGNEIFMIDTTDGSLMWDKDGPDGFGCDFLGMGDIDNDNNDEVIAINDDIVVALEGTNGNQIWNKTLERNAYSLAVGDINADSYDDVIVGPAKFFSGDVAVTALNGSNGAYLWNFTTSGTSNHIIDIEITDLYNDSTPEIIAGGSMVYVLNNTGGENWSKTGYVNTLAIGDFDADGVLDIAYGRRSGYWVYAFNGLNGSTIFERQLTSNPEYFQIDAADYDQDNYGELIVCDFADDLVMLEKNTYPDTSIQSSDISFSPSVPYQGENVTINCSISNDGNANVTNCKVSIYHDNQSAINLIENRTIDVGIYSPTQVVVTWNTSGYVGNHDIIVRADPDNLIFESNESNNLAIKTLFIMDPSIGPNIQLISPLNTTYNVPDVPVNIMNSTEVHMVWFRYSTTGGSSWTGNFSLTYDGISFKNSTVWVDDHYLLQVFANNSYGKLSILEANFVIEILRNNYSTDFLSTTPNIDGILNPNEWGAITFNRTISTGDAHFYLKTNLSYLFIACDFIGDTAQNINDRLAVLIDEDHNHVLSSNKEHEFVIFGDGVTFYYYWSGIFWNVGTKPAGFLGVVSHSTGHAVYEMQIPLNAIPASISKIIGCGIVASDDDNAAYAEWPLNLNGYDPTTWGDLELRGYFTIQVPRNVTHNFNTIPIVIQNSSYVDSGWYRNSTGAGWSENSTLTWNGSHFTNGSLLFWEDGNYHLQVFVNNSVGEVYQMDQWFIVDTAIPPSIDLISPENIIYPNEYVPIVVTNSSEVETCWFRNSTDGGSSWSANFTLTFDGMNFTNSTILIWQGGIHYLQVFANNSFGKISMQEEWFSISVPPSVIIEAPLNQTYYNNTVSVNLSSPSPDVDALWYRVRNQTTWITSNITWSAGAELVLSDGFYTLYALGNNSLGQESMPVSVNFTIDTTPLIAIIDSPLNTTYNTQTIQINLSCTDPLLDAMWYQVHNGTAWVVPKTIWMVGANEVLPDGIYTLYAWANDTLGQNQSLPSNVTFTIDTTAPIVNIISPINDTYHVSSVLVNLSSAAIDLDSIWYRIYNNTADNWLDSTNLSWFNPVQRTLTDSYYTLYAWANDTFGNVVTIPTNINFTIDAPPLIISISLINGTVYSPEDLILNIIINAADLDAVWYRIHDGTTWMTGNVTWTGPISLQLGEGDYIIYIWANDTQGNEVLNIVSFYVQLPPTGDPRFIWIVIIAVGAVSAVVIFYKKRKSRKTKKKAKAKDSSASKTFAERVKPID